MTIITFDNFWRKFHEVTNQTKLNKSTSRRLFDSTINQQLKSDAFYNITKGIKLTALDYLKQQFKLG